MRPYSGQSIICWRVIFVCPIVVVGRFKVTKPIPFKEKELGFPFMWVYKVRILKGMH
jgi:hypothetical protein